MPEKGSRLSTSGLLRGLFKTSNLVGFFKRHEEDMRIHPLSTYLRIWCEERGMKRKDIIINGDIDRTYAHQLFNGTRMPSRDMAIKLAFGFKMDYDETQTLLKRAGRSQLNPRLKRDAVIIYAIKKRHTILELQNMLDELSLPLLGS